MEEELPGQESNLRLPSVAAGYLGELHYSTGRW